MKAHPKLEWERVDSSANPREPSIRTESEEHQLLLARRAAAKATEDNRRKATLAYWRTRDKAMVTKLKAFWAERDKASPSKPRLKDYVCDTCNRPFATVRKIASNANVRCAPCARAIRSQQKRASYYRHHAEIRAKQNEYFPIWYAGQPKTKPPVQSDYRVPIIPDPWQPAKGNGPRIVWTPSPKADDPI